MSSNPCGRSLLSVVDDAARTSCHSPAALRIKAAELGLKGCAGELSVLELREVLGRRDTAVTVKNRAWALLITHAQHENQTHAHDRAHGADRVWALAAIAVALPGLRSVVGELADGARGSRADLEAEVLAGFLTALMRARTANQQRFPALTRAARRAGVDWLRHSRDAPPTVDEDTSGALVGVAVAHAGHPDVVLADAVEAGILTSAEAELIAATRIERRPLREIAALHGISSNAVWMRRDRAEKRLVAGLARAVEADDADRVNDPTHAQLLATTPLTRRLSPIPANPDATNARAATGHTEQIDHGRARAGHGHPLSAQSPPVPGHSRQRQSPQRHPRCGQPGHGQHPATMDGRPDGSHPDTHPLLAGHPPGGHAPAVAGAVACASQSITMPEPDRVFVRRGARTYPSAHRRSVGGAAVALSHQSRLPGITVWITVLMLVVGLGLGSQAQASPPRGDSTSHRSTVAVVATAFVTPTATTAPTFRPSPRERQRMRWSRYPFTNGRPGRPDRQLLLAQASPDGTAQLTRVLTNIRNWLLGLLITLATLCLTIGGVRYLLAGGDPGEVEAAKRAIKSAAIGYALAVLAPAFVAVLRSLVGT